MNNMWIIKRTGEVRVPKKDEYYLGIDDGEQVIIRCQGINPFEREILSIEIVEEVK